MKMITTHKSSQDCGVDFSELDKVVAVRIETDELEGPVMYIEYTDRQGVTHHVEATKCRII